MKVKQLNQLATEMVGDGKRKNVFFFTVEGDVRLVGTEFNVIHSAWKQFVMDNPRVETMIEDRKNGVVASAGMEEILLNDDTMAKRWLVIDDSKRFGLRD